MARHSADCGASARLALVAWACAGTANGQIAQQDPDPNPPDELQPTLLIFFIALGVLLLIFTCGAAVFVVTLKKEITKEKEEIEAMDRKLDELKVSRDNAQATELDTVNTQLEKLREAYYECVLNDVTFTKAHNPRFYEELKEKGLIQLVGDGAYDGTADEERDLDEEIERVIDWICGKDDEEARKEFKDFFAGMNAAQRAQLLQLTADTDPKVVGTELRTLKAESLRLQRKRELEEEGLQLRAKLIALDRDEMGHAEEAKRKDVRDGEVEDYKQMSPRLELEEGAASPSIRPPKPSEDEPYPTASERLFRDPAAMEEILAPGVRDNGTRATTMPRLPEHLEQDTKTGAKLRKETAALEAAQEREKTAANKAKAQAQIGKTMDRLRIEKRKAAADKTLRERLRRNEEAIEPDPGGGASPVEGATSLEAVPDDTPADAPSVPKFITAPWEHGKPSPLRPPGSSAFGRPAHARRPPPSRIPLSAASTPRAPLAANPLHRMDHDNEMLPPASSTPYIPL